MRPGEGEVEGAGIPNRQPRTAREMASGRASPLPEESRDVP